MQTIVKDNLVYLYCENCDSYISKPKDTVTSRSPEQKELLSDMASFGMRQTDLRVYLQERQPPALRINKRNGIYETTTSFLRGSNHLTHMWRFHDNMDIDVYYVLTYLLQTEHLLRC